MDPIIFSFNIGSLEFAFRWYGLMIAVGVMFSTWIAEKEIVRRGGKAEWVWDALLWALPAAVIGARFWYVVNDILGGGRIFIDQPARIWRISEGGLHIFGSFVFGLIAVYLYARRNRADILLLLDAIAPSLLIGQAIGRLGNFINQELYGPPTDLPWGIAIDAPHRMPPWNDLTLYPEATTRFHPTFAYEMLWNLLSAGLILWLTRKFKDKFKPGAAFASWMLLAGAGRVFIEAFRPDQPRIPGTDFSWSRLIYLLLAIAGLVWLLVRNEVIKVSFLSPGPEKYKLPKKRRKKY
ncbi:MAG: prolipoprotein diacylglyceryl transferase [Anaerolineales bacterium]|nr:prolipoprotein diacylglyceryl transferase [Anaerolineales bacterium]